MGRDAIARGPALLALLATGFLLLGCSPAAENEAPEDCPPRVVFVLIDALRKDHLGVFGYRRPTSPTIDRLSREGLFLANVLVSSSHTVPSVVSIMTARLPSAHGVHYWRSSPGFSPSNVNAVPHLAPGLETMAQHFADSGYYAAGVVTNPWLKAEFGFDRGFDEYVEIGWEDGRDVNREAKRILGENPSEPIFLYLHYLDVHNPYLGRTRGEPPFERPAKGELKYHNGLVTDVSEDDLRFTETLYDERIHYMDGHIEELMAFAESADLACDTTWVLTSDHGDEFMEHGGMGHGTTLYGELVDSFAIFWNPRRFEPRRVDRMVAAPDLLPTLLEGQGLEPLPGAGGVSVLGQRPPSGPASPLVAEFGDRRAIVTPEWKLIQNLDQGTVELYPVRDWGAIEDRDLSESNEGVVERLSAQLVAATRETREREHPEEEIDAATRERLRALGYLE